MTEQEVFDKTWNGLASQGFERSMIPDADDECAYRGADGKRCAAGWLIPDDEYDPSMEGRGIYILIESRQVSIPISHRQLLERLQGAHDNARDPADMRSRLRYVAAQHGLTVPGDRED